MSPAPSPRVLLPSLLAGPAVMLFLLAAEWSARFTCPIALSPNALAAMAAVLPVSVVVGVGPALLANALGTLAMIKFGNWFPLVRFPLVWAVVGGLVAWGIVRQFGFGAEWTFAYTATGAVSALLCRMRLA